MSRNYQNSDDFRRYENDQAHAEERADERAASRRLAAENGARVNELYIGFNHGIAAAVAAARAAAAELHGAGATAAAIGVQAFSDALELSYPKNTRHD